MARKTHHIVIFKNVARFFSFVLTLTLDPERKAQNGESINPKCASCH
jgi:hypothetical protein